MRHLHTISVASLIALMAVSASAEAAPCTVVAQNGSIANVIIRPVGEATFALNLEHVPMEARLSGTKFATLHVDGPLRFTTKHPWTKLGLVRRTKLSIRDGMLTVPRGTPPHSEVVQSLWQIALGESGFPGLYKW